MLYNNFQNEGVTQHYVSVRIGSEWATLNSLNIIWKSNLLRPLPIISITRITDTIREQRLMKTYLDQLIDDTMCTNEELPIAMNDIEEWR